MSYNRISNLLAGDINNLAETAQYMLSLRVPEVRDGELDSQAAHLEEAYLSFIRELNRTIKLAELLEFADEATPPEDMEDAI